MGDLSVFVDESGDVGSNSELHIVALVFHEQDRPVDADLVRLGAELRDVGFPVGEPVHAGPLIRREEPFGHLGMTARRRALARLLAFVRRAGVSHAVLSVRKSELGARGPDGLAARLESRLARGLALFLRERLAYFTSFDRVVVYYDGGQAQVSRALRQAFRSELSRVEFRRAAHRDYRLLQAADLMCTLELLRLKDAAGRLSRSELAFFGSAGRLRKNYLRDLERLRMP